MNFGKKLFVFLAIFVLVVLGLLLIAFRSRITYLGRAADVNIPSLSHSYLFASPLVAQANGQASCKISAFLLNEQGQGVEGKEVQISSQPSLTINPVRSQTDKYGEAIFEATSDQPGQFAVSASFQGQSFPQMVTLTFR